MQMQRDSGTDPGGRLDARPLITHTCTLSGIEKAYRIFENHEDGVMKYAVYPE